MADSAADRKRRSRRHQAGDHSLCVPGRCEEVTPVVTVTDTSGPRDVKPVLGESGQRLWLSMTEAGQLPPLHMTLLLEACRIADRLDKLDAKLRGEDRDWLSLDLPEDGSIAVVVVDKALSESRQQATALKQIVSELRQVASRQAAPRQQPRAKVGGNVSSIAAKVAARRAASSG